MAEQEPPQTPDEAYPLRELMTEIEALRLRLRTLGSRNRSPSRVQLLALTVAQIITALAGAFGFGVCLYLAVMASERALAAAIGWLVLAPINALYTIAMLAVFAHAKSPVPTK